MKRIKRTRILEPTTRRTIAITKEDAAAVTRLARVEGRSWTRQAATLIREALAARGHDAQG